MTPKKKKTERVVVVDLEATCWKGDPPPGQAQEIIEVGAVLVELWPKPKILEPALSWFVKPVWSRVSQFCTELTTIRQVDVDCGSTLRTVCSSLRAAFPNLEQLLWASYGDFDRKLLERECRAKSAEYPFGGRHLNLKTMCAVVHGWRNEVGMAKALEMSGLNLVGTHHRGQDDARNIARLLVHTVCMARRIKE